MRIPHLGVRYTVLSCQNAVSPLKGRGHSFDQSCTPNGQWEHYTDIEKKCKRFIWTMGFTSDFFEMTCVKLLQNMTKRAIMHFTIEFIPTFGFFIAAQVTTFYFATIILMALSFFSFTVGWLWEKKLPTLPIIITIFVLISGSLTIYYGQPDVLILSNSIYYLGFGAVLLAGLAFKQNLLRRIFNETFAITDTGWHILTIRWGMLLIIVGLGNEYIRLVYDEQTWVTYKLVATITMTVFTLSQLTLSKHYRIPEESNELGIRTHDTKRPVE